MTTQRYDYIIVGAGSAGCVLANRLSADPSVRVLLLEAGGWDIDPLIHIPLGIGMMHKHTLHDWGYHSEPEPNLGGRRVEAMRGKVLGGSSSINVTGYTRGDQRDYDRWAQKGALGWSYADVLPYFKRTRDLDRRRERDARRRRADRRRMGARRRSDLRRLARGRNGGRLPHHRGQQRRRHRRLRQEPIHDPQRAALVGIDRLSQAGASSQQPHPDDARAGRQGSDRGPARGRDRVDQRWRDRTGAGGARDHIGGRHVQHAAAADAVGHRAGGPSAQRRHRSAGRPAGRQEFAGPPGGGDLLQAQGAGTVSRPDAVRPHGGQHAARIFPGLRPRHHHPERDPRLHQDAAGTRHARCRIHVSGLAAVGASVVSAA